MSFLSKRIRIHKTDESSSDPSSLMIFDIDNGNPSCEGEELGGRCRAMRAWKVRWRIAGLKVSVGTQ